MTTGPSQAAGVRVPDTRLAVEAAELVRDTTGELVYNHSHRVYLFGALQGRRRHLSFDPELLYIGALFHDLGLDERFHASGRRFEVDSADEARRFLQARGVPEDSVRRVWTAIALHTTPGIPAFMEPEVALVTAGVEYDVLGIGYDDVSDADRAAIVALHPRPDFKRRILAAFTEGVRPKPGTTFGNVKADVLHTTCPASNAGTSYAPCSIRRGRSDSRPAVGRTRRTDADAPRRSGVIVMTVGRAEALARLDVFVGEWTLEPRFPDIRPPVPGPEGDGPGARTWFEWALDGQVLVQRTEIPVPEAPDGLMVVRADPGNASYTQHYFDSRGVARLYSMTFDGRVWTLTRESPDFTPLDFRQRFTGTFSEDGNTIAGAWEVRFDGGEWEHDFALTYRRAG